MLTTRQELALVREALQGLIAGRGVVSFSVDGMTVTYSAQHIHWLREREAELAARLCRAEQLKRVIPDFS